MHVQRGALMVHLVAQEGVAALHRWRDHVTNALHLAPVLAGYFPARPGDRRDVHMHGTDRP